MDNPGVIWALSVWAYLIFGFLSLIFCPYYYSKEKAVTFYLLWPIFILLMLIKESIPIIKDIFNK